MIYKWLAKLNLKVTHLSSLPTFNKSNHTFCGLCQSHLDVSKESIKNPYFFSLIFRFSFFLFIITYNYIRNARKAKFSYLVYLAQVMHIFNRGYRVCIFHDSHTFSITGYTIMSTVCLTERGRFNKIKIHILYLLFVISLALVLVAGWVPKYLL